MNLTALMLMNGLNQRALAGQSGVSEATINRVVTGRGVTIKGPNMKKVADALGVKIMDIDEFVLIIRAAEVNNDPKPELVGADKLARVWVFAGAGSDIPTPALSL